MLLRKFLKISSLLLLFPWLLSSCGTSSSVADNNNSLSPAIVIEAAANIPVLDGNSAQTGIYVHNTTDKTISGISYALAETGSTTSLTLNATACNSIEANSSCLLPIATPALTPGNKGSNVIVASYDNTQSKQLVNYSYVSAADYTGVSFSNTSQKLFGGNNYATVYVFAGNHKTIDNVDFTISSASVQISNGLTNNKLNLAANTVNALEIHSTANFTDQLVTVTASQSTSQSPNNSRLASAVTADNSIENNTLIVTITPSQQANLLMSNVPILTEEAPSAILTVANNGNTDAIINGILVANTTSVAVAQATENPCGDGMALASGATCNYLIVKVNATQNGSAILTLNYNDSLADTSTAQTVYYHNNVAFPAVSAIPDATQLTVPVDVASGTITFNINNYGKGALNTVAIAPKTTLKNTTAAIETNDCGTTLTAGASCSLSVKVTATGVIDSGVVYLNISGSFTDIQGASHSLNFASEPAAITVADTTNPVLSSTIPANNALSVSMATGITLNFSEPMDPLTLNTTNIKLIKVSNSTAVPLTSLGVTNNNTTVTFKQTSGTLAADTQYKVVMSPNAVKDINGNAVDSATQYAVFTTGNTATPTVSSVIPANGAINQAVNVAVKVTFSEEMNPATLTTSTIILRVKGTTTQIATGIDYTSSTDNTATISHANLTKGEWYELVLKRASIKDMDGKAMGTSDQIISTFQVDNGARPTIEATYPTNGSTTLDYYATKDSTAGTISLTFSEPMNTATLTTTNIKLRSGSSTGTSVTLSNPVYSNNNQTVTFTTANLLDSTNYYLMYIPSAVKDAAGNAVSTVTTATVAAGFTIQYPIVVISPAKAIVYRGSNLYRFKATLSGSGRTTLTMTVASGGGLNGATVSPTSCSLSPTGLRSCVFTVSASSAYNAWTTSLVNNNIVSYTPSFNITTTNDALTFVTSTSSLGQATPANIAMNLDVSTPSVYLASPTGTTTSPGVVMSDSSRFTKNGKCITDNLTGLMWPTITIGFTYVGTNNLDPTPDISGDAGQYQNDATKISQTTQAIANLNALASPLCGYDDWRMPTATEWMSLIDYSDPDDNRTRLRALGLGLGTGYWISSAAIEPYEFDTSGKGIYQLTSTAVRGIKPVRGGYTTPVANRARIAKMGAGSAGSTAGVAWPTFRFEDAIEGGAGGCMIDTLTGLMWAKNATIGFLTTSGGSTPSDQPNYSNSDRTFNIMSYSDATTSIANLNAASQTLCGFSDWRLPNALELASLLDFTQDGVAYLSNYFSNVDTAYYWTKSSAGTDNPENKASRVRINFSNYTGNPVYYGYTSGTTSATGLVWPVRGGM